VWYVAFYFEEGTQITNTSKQSSEENVSTSKKDEANEHYIVFYKSANTVRIVKSRSFG
jgi:hypothetical protein